MSTARGEMRRETSVAAVITTLGLLCLVAMTLQAQEAEEAACDCAALGAERQELTETYARGSGRAVYLPVVARHYGVPAPIEPITASLSYATNESWAWASCAVAHDGTEWSEWLPGADRVFRATAYYRAHHLSPDYDYWNFYRGYLWTVVPDIDGAVIRATLHVALCYHTTWPTQTGRVAWHTGTWPEVSPLAEDGSEAWHMYEGEPFAVLEGGDLPRSYERGVGGTCDRQSPSYVDVTLPLSQVEPGQVLRVLARDTKDAPDCAMAPGSWGTHLIKPETAELRLHPGGDDP